MIAARSGRNDIINILLEGKHIDLDLQENVSVFIIKLFTGDVNNLSLSSAIGNYIHDLTILCPFYKGGCLKPTGDCLISRWNQIYTSRRQRMYTYITIICHKSYCFHRLEGGLLSTFLLRMETQLQHMLSSKQELMSTSKTRSWIVINSLSFKLCSLSLYRMGGQLWRLLKSSQQMKRLQPYPSGICTTEAMATKE